MLSPAPSFPGKVCLLTVALALAGSALFVSPASAQTETVLHDFMGGTAGSYPFSNLTPDGHGNFYGESQDGGSWAEGNIFELSPDGTGGWIYRDIFEFGPGEGGQAALPSGPLVLDEDGNVYGATMTGGVNSTGVVYRLEHVGGASSITYLYTFGPRLSADGDSPNGVTYFHGALFGTTTFGGKNGSGTVFVVRPDQDGGWSESILHNFAANENDGQRPSGGLALDSKGNIYGTTQLGGSHQGGVVFELVRGANGGWHEQILHSFVSLDGYEPGSATPILDSHGNLYSTTVGGGTGGGGVVFELSPSGTKWREKVLHNFTGGEDGASPYAGVTFDSHGRLFGTTAWGGGNGSCWTNDYQNLYCGTVYTLRPSESGAWTESILYRFSDGLDGGVPFASVVLDSQDNIYGVTTDRGTSLYGVAFELSSSTEP
jgi:uncharacterized repeat protein (TIGR03803 family)